MGKIDRSGLRAQTSPQGDRLAIRTCVGCRGTDSRSTLLRVVAVQREGTYVLELDEQRRLPGRGAWLHPSNECLEKAIQRRAFARALRVPASSMAPVRLSLPQGDPLEDH